MRAACRGSPLGHSGHRTHSSTSCTSPALWGQYRSRGDPSPGSDARPWDDGPVRLPGIRWTRAVDARLYDHGRGYVQSRPEIDSRWPVYRTCRAPRRFSPRTGGPTHSPTANWATPPQPQQCGECSTTGTPAPAAASWGMASPAGGAGAWWPAELGVPAASGSQNALRYASFPVQRCLVIAVHEHVWLYNTLDHQMSGVPQEQGRGSTVWWRSPPCR
jgi:hypothetical protein